MLLNATALPLIFVCFCFFSIENVYFIRTLTKALTFVVEHWHFHHNKLLECYFVTRQMPQIQYFLDAFKFFIEISMNTFPWISILNSFHWKKKSHGTNRNMKREMNFPNFIALLWCNLFLAITSSNHTQSTKLNASSAFTRISVGMCKSFKSLDQNRLHSFMWKIIKTRSLTLQHKFLHVHSSRSRWC